MKYGTRIYYSESQKALMWDRWRRGESLQQIAQLFDRNHSSVQRILALSGGIRPPERRRSTRHSAWASEKRYRAGSPQANRCGPSPPPWVERLPR